MSVTLSDIDVGIKNFMNDDPGSIDNVIRRFNELSTEAAELRWKLNHESAQHDRRKAEAIKYRALAERLASDALCELASIACTPEEGYLEAPGWLRHDIKYALKMAADIERDAILIRVRKLYEDREYIDVSPNAVFDTIEAKK